jgi:hypothetical protein
MKLKAKNMSELVTPDDFKAEITLNYGRFKEEPQTRNERGQLTDVLARLFEGRMNQALDEYHSMLAFAGEVAIVNG